MDATGRRRIVDLAEGHGFEPGLTESESRNEFLFATPQARHRAPRRKPGRAAHRGGASREQHPRLDSPLPSVSGQRTRSQGDRKPTDRGRSSARHCRLKPNLAAPRERGRHSRRSPVISPRRGGRIYLIVCACAGSIAPNRIVLHFASMDYIRCSAMITITLRTAIITKPTAS